MIKKNAIIHIVYDPKTRRMRARYDNAWVRFPKDLRSKAYSFLVSELKPNALANSWIACGAIVPL